MVEIGGLTKSREWNSRMTDFGKALLNLEIECNCIGMVNKRS